MTGIRGRGLEVLTVGLVSLSVGCFSVWADRPPAQYHPSQGQPRCDPKGAVILDSVLLGAALATVAISSIRADEKAEDGGCFPFCDEAVFVLAGFAGTVAQLPPVLVGARKLSQCNAAKARWRSWQSLEPGERDLLERELREERAEAVQQEAAQRRAAQLRRAKAEAIARRNQELRAVLAEIAEKTGQLPIWKTSITWR